MKSFLYVLGDNPYDNAHGDYHTEGNGEWFSNAPTVDEALTIIFGNMPFPGEAAGRKFFLEGVSLPGVHEREVIQVWSNEPEIVKRTRKLLRKDYDGLHDGRGRDFGLHLELKVTDIERYITPERKLLAAPAGDPNATDVILSPMGVGLLKYGETKFDIQMAMQSEKMELTRRKWEVSNMEDELEEKMKLMRQQLGVLNTYLHGTRYRVQLTSGSKGTGRYTVFQNRQFLSEEIALLGNFVDFDFKKMEDLEKWLVQSGRIWKFLPFERCILATRIRQERKDYGDPFANLYNNMANMQNIVWIRDGENVYHVDVEFNFHNAIFPDKNQFERAFRTCLNHVWSSGFKWQPPKNWHGERLKPGEYDVMGKMRRKPLEEEEPYYTHTILKQRFKKLDEWLDSEFYTDLLDKQMRHAVQDYLRGVNKRQMVFAVLLQGIVDNTNLLDIPKGTDLFDWNVIDQYFNLVFDYTHVLPWRGVSDKIAPFIDGHVEKGDWIAVILSEYIPPPEERRPYGKGTTYKEHGLVLAEVVDLQEVEVEYLSKEPGGERTKKKVTKPVIRYYPKVTRHSWKRTYEENEQSRTKAPIKLLVRTSKFVRMPLPPSLATQILDDRDWKKENKWAVPIMVNYKKVISALKSKKFTVMDFYIENKD